jgi:hypothetical protein
MITLDEFADLWFNYSVALPSSLPSVRPSFLPPFPLVVIFQTLPSFLPSLPLLPPFPSSSFQQVAGSPKSPIANARDLIGKKRNSFSNSFTNNTKKKAV